MSKIKIGSLWHAKTKELDDSYVQVVAVKTPVLYTKTEGYKVMGETWVHYIPIGHRWPPPEPTARSQTDFNARYFEVEVGGAI